jgi:hypothetical protein
MNEPFVLQILFTRIGGSHAGPPAPGRLSAVISLGAIRFNDFRGEMTAFEDGEDARLRRPTPTEADVRSLIGALKAAGFPARLPAVSGNVDTSEVWSRNLLEVDDNGKVQRLVLDLMATGYDGPDRAAVQALFARLFTIAGVRSAALWNDLAGRDPNAV